MTGDELKNARESLGLTVTELAERLQLSMPNGRTFIRELERGKQPISGPISVAVELMLKQDLRDSM